MLKLILPFFFFISTVSMAQDDEDWRLYKPSGKTKEIGNSDRVNVQAEARNGHIMIKADKRIIEMDSLRKAHPSAMEGYRVQVFFGNRNEAQKLRGDFLRKYPDTGAYVSYLAPNFRLRVGDFRTKTECEKFKRDLLSDFPGSYIVKDQISLPALREVETE